MAQIGLSMALGQQTHRGNNCVLGLEARSGAFKGTAFTSLDTVADGQAQQMGASWGKQDWESRGRGGERMEGKGSGWLEGGQGLGGQGERSRVSSVCRQWDLLIPLSSPRPSLALSCGASLLFLCLQLCRGLGLLGHLRTFLCFPVRLGTGGLTHSSEVCASGSLEAVSLGTLLLPPARVPGPSSVS